MTLNPELNPHCRIGKIKLKNRMETEIYRFPDLSISEIADDLLVNARRSIDIHGDDLAGYIIVSWGNDFKNDIGIAYWNDHPHLPTAMLPDLFKVKLRSYIEQQSA